MMIENWRPVIGYEDLYEVSDHGRVRSGARWDYGARGGAKRFYSERIRKLIPAWNGYLHVGLRKDEKNRRYSVHSLVMAAFVGPRPKGMDICHNDGTRDNNRLDNLRYDTRKGNFADNMAHGTKLYGERQNGAKITEEIARFIISNYKRYEKQYLAEMLGISRHTVVDVGLRRTWKHLDVNQAAMGG